MFALGALHPNVHRIGEALPAVDVAAHRDQRGDVGERLKDRSVADVAGMQYGVGFKRPNERFGARMRVAVGVGNDRNACAFRELGDNFGRVVAVNSGRGGASWLAVGT